MATHSITTSHCHTHGQGQQHDVISHIDYNGISNKLHTFIYHPIFKY